MPPDGFDRDDVTHALDALAAEVQAPTADARSLIARGRRRVIRQRTTVAIAALAMIAVLAGVGALASNNDDTRVVAPTTTVAPSAVGRARFIAVASALEAWKCVDPLQYTEDGGRTWKVVPAPVHDVSGSGNCTAVEGGNFWAASGSQIVRVRQGTDVEVLRFPHLGTDEQLLTPAFVDADHGWIQTYGNNRTLALYRTTDGGTTWKLLSTRQGLGQLSFTDSEHGASRYGNTVTVTADGGETWQAVSGPGLPSSFKVEVHGQSIVLWGGSHIAGSQYRTLFGVSTDRGHAWIRRNGPDGFELPSVQNFFDAADATHWVLASGPALGVTDDAGRSWQRRPDLPRQQSVGMIASPTADTVWLASQTGRILRSTDAARTWTDVTDGATPESATTTTTTLPSALQRAAPPQFAFTSGTEGWICSEQPSHSTHDFELTPGYTSVNIPPNPSAVDGDYPQVPLCAAAPGGNFWLVRDSASESLSEIVHVTIRATGEETSVSPFNTEPFGRIEALDFVDAKHGWALVAYQHATLRTLYATRDGGVNWSRLGDAPIRSALEFEDTTHGWSTSNDDSANLAATTDGGRSWHKVHVPTKKYRGQYSSIHPVLVNGKLIVAYGQAGTGMFFEPFFDVSTDGGRTWSIRTAPSSIQLSGTYPSDFAAADADHWAIGTANLLYVTNDGGRTWTERQQVAGLDSIHYVARPSADAMFVSGYRDASGKSTVVLGSTDGGVTWSAIDSPSPAESPTSVAPEPGGIIGCPTRPLTPGEPTFLIAEAAAEYAHVPRTYVRNVYSGSSTEGDYASIFRFNVGSCGARVLDQIYVAYVIGPPNAGPGGSTRRVTLALAHYADGWHVFGRYP